ncbi:hypothetical protein ACFWMR_31155 [Amycolatopsis thailandensis]|uniref:hypothetical protein n=1 Tax=Amycolatopsis thailandensis TaxID=589330 RepID=UPI00364B9FA4
MSGAWETLRYRDFRYHLQQIEVREVGPAEVVRSELSVRVLATADGGRLIQKTVHREAGRADPELYALLDREIRAGARLLRRFSETAYPAELSKMVGYDIDREDPFVLLEHTPGAPVRAQAGNLLTGDQHAFEVGFFRALRLIEAAKLVHGGLSLDAVWRGSGGIQVTSFEHAVLAGEPRVRNRVSRSCPPDQRAVRGTASPRDDVWSAGAVLMEVVTGGDPGPAPDAARFGPALAELLSSVFHPDPAARPTASDLLARLGESDHVPPRPDGAAREFAASRQRFDEVLDGKRRGRSGEPAHAGESPSTRLRTLYMVAGVVAVVVVVAVGYALGVIG